VEDLGVDGKVTLKWIVKKLVGESPTRFIWLGIGRGGGFCECGNEPSGSIKCGEFLGQMMNS
jgi:hypothetical protein